MKKTTTGLFILFVFCFLFHRPFVAGQDTPTSPYEATYQLLYYLQEDSYNPARASLAIHPSLDSIVRINHAIKIKQVLDGRGLYIQLNQIPDDPEYRDSLSKRAIYTLFPKMLPEVYLEKTGSFWYFSLETSQIINELHKKVYPFGTDQIINLLPASYDRKFLGLKIWQYIGILTFIILALALHFILSRLINFTLNRLKWLNRFSDKKQIEDIFRISKLFSIWVILYLSKKYLAILQLGIQYTEFAMITLRLAQVFVLLLILLRMVNIFSHFAAIFADKTESKMDEQLLPIVVKLTKIFIVGVFLIQILTLLKVNVTALIAGVSIGGLALALAAQDTVKNLIGSVLIFIDKPFQIGDYIIAGGFDGTVEEVGFRSTRIRTIGSSIISVPNGQLANLSLENLGIRPYRMMKVNLGILYSTPASKITEYIETLKKLVTEFPEINDEGYYIHFTELKDSALNILFRVNLSVATYQEELATKEKILLRIFSEAEQVGVEFAYPSTSVYLENHPENTANEK